MPRDPARAVLAAYAREARADALRMGRHTAHQSRKGRRGRVKLASD